MAYPLSDAEAFRSLRHDREDATDAEIRQAKATVQAMDTNEKYSVEVLDGMGNDIKLSTVQANPAHRVLLPMLKKLATTR